jgi:membrane associated rhomboid family serine protease
MNQASKVMMDVRDQWNRWGRIEHLMLLNGLVFVLLWGSSWFGWRASILNLLALPPNPLECLWKPWTLFTYALTHQGFWHLLWNMLLLHWAAHFLVSFLGPKVILKFYGGGALVGALLFWLGTGWSGLWNGSGLEQLGGIPPLIGASAAVMSFFWASVLLAPDFELRLFGILPIRLRWLGIAMLVYDGLGLFSANSGGHWAHLGGALWGFGYLRHLQGALRFPSWGLDSATSSKRLDAKNLHSIQSETDRLLDKISKSGFSSLKASEKQWLDQHHRS